MNHLIVGCADEDFTEKKHFDYHVNNHDKMIYKCPGPQCRYLFQKLKYFQKHAFSCHDLRITTKNMVQYEIKKEKPKTVKRHTSFQRLKKVHNFSDVKCHLCGRRFLNLINKEFHLLNHDKMIYQCPDPCGYKFMKLPCLNRHSTSCHGMRLTEEVARVPENGVISFVRNKSSLGKDKNMTTPAVTKYLPNVGPNRNKEGEKLRCSVCQRRFRDVDNKSLPREKP